MPDSRTAGARSGRRRAIVAGVAVVACALIALWPVTTRFGVDYQWSERRITFGEKAIHFVSRDLQMRRLAATIAAGRPTDEAGIVALYEWVRENVKRTPPDMHVADDHPLNILIRGYGAPDQQAEALAILASYRGRPATAVGLRVTPRGDVVVLTVVQLDAKQVAFDVRNGVVFRRRDGSLADVADLVHDPSIVAAAAGSKTLSDVPYARFIERLASVQPSFARMEKQKPWGRMMSAFWDRAGR